MTIWGLFRLVFRNIGNITAKIANALRHAFFADVSKEYQKGDYGLKHPIGTTNTPSGRR